MQDTNLFETILGLQTPWHVARVALDRSGERVDLWVEHDADARWTCPECAQAAPGHDHADERVWQNSKYSECRIAGMPDAEGPAGRWRSRQRAAF